jgi:hypothetical protein
VLWFPSWMLYIDIEKVAEAKANPMTSLEPNRRALTNGTGLINGTGLNNGSGMKNVLDMASRIGFVNGSNPNHELYPIEMEVTSLK